MKPSLYLRGWKGVVLTQELTLEKLAAREGVSHEPRHSRDSWYVLWGGKNSELGLLSFEAGGATGCEGSPPPCARPLGHGLTVLGSHLFHKKDINRKDLVCQFTSASLGQRTSLLGSKRSSSPY